MGNFEEFWRLLLTKLQKKLGEQDVLVAPQ